MGPTRLLPWLSLTDVIESTRELGRLTGRAKEADDLAARLGERLTVAPPVNAPRVLLVIGYRPGKLDEVWFIRDNSLHGAALQAAGARNAVFTPRTLYMPPTIRRRPTAAEFPLALRRGRLHVVRTGHGDLVDT